MKVDNLLGPYLYQYKRLSLPGIGLFTLADNAVLPDDTAKVKTAIEGISFTSKTGTQLDDSLIQYIKDETGKMKALAEADLNSYIATAFQYLNIGKSFYFEGIGTLQKNKDNNYTFSAGTMIPQRADEVQLKHIEAKKKSAFVDDDASGKSGFNAGRLVVLLAVLVTLGLIGWGGYYLYNKNTGNKETAVQTETKPVETITDTASTAATDTTTKKPDSGLVAASTDSVKPASIKTATETIPPNGYKFILETTAKKTRAASRYEQIKGISMLKEYNNKAAIETNDSLTFKIYTIVPCTAADTARVKEQLNAWYYGSSAIKVKIEQ